MYVTQEAKPLKSVCEGFKECEAWKTEATQMKLYIR